MQYYQFINKSPSHYKVKPNPRIEYVIIICKIKTLIIEINRNYKEVNTFTIT